MAGAIETLFESKQGRRANAATDGGGDDEMAEAIMSELTPRRKLPNRRENRNGRLIWRTAGGDLPFHVCIGFEPLPRHFGKQLGRPLEIFLTPSRRAGRTGAAIHFCAGDIAETLSLLLQHGHSFASLRSRFKPGSLARVTVEFAWLFAHRQGSIIVADEPLPDPMPEALRLVVDDLERMEGGNG
jgi:hypothetical protein